ncbi:Regulator of G-protein signaling 7 [Quaeritorhiza haematococci]|nr:Regulator of G-protein signaling 7 [Quaeritorhiza haematococci]
MASESTDTSVSGLPEGTVPDTLLSAKSSSETDVSLPKSEGLKSKDVSRVRFPSPVPGAASNRADSGSLGASSPPINALDHHNSMPHLAASGSRRSSVSEGSTQNSSWLSTGSTLSVPSSSRPHSMKHSSGTFGPSIANIAAALRGKTITENLAPIAKRSQIQCKRLAMMEDAVTRMQKPDSGLDIRDRKKMFKVNPSCFLGSEMVDWILVNCGFFIREEALRFASYLLENGYIISVDLLDNFQPESYYVFQNPYFWPSHNWNPSDEDYAVYLLRKASKKGTKAQVREYEVERLFKLRSMMQRQWPVIEETTKEHFKVIQDFSKTERRLLHLHEHGFWRVHRPPADLTESQLLQHLEKKVEQLQFSLTSNRIKVSHACKGLIARCDLLRPTDPLLEQPILGNPWVMDDTLLWDTERKYPTLAEIRIWCHSLTDLLRDPLGVTYFMEFLKKEFSEENLEFWLRCEELDKTSTKTEFMEMAIEIFTEFIPTSSPRELNIDATTRQNIIAYFQKEMLGKHGLSESFEKLLSVSVADLATSQTLKKHKAKGHSYYCFSEALRSVFALMAKDPYPRFCVSDIVKELQAAAIQRERTSLLLTPLGSSVASLSPLTHQKRSASPFEVT